jgi:ketosteroid isomerase-like protein
MSRSNHQLVRDFFTALPAGDFPDDLFTDDLTVWTITSAASGKAKYLSGLKMLQSLFPGGLTYRVDSLTAEDDRVAAEVRGHGTLVNGDEYHNTYVFIFRIRDARIARISEYFNTLVVREKLAPLMQAAANRHGG